MVYGVNIKLQTMSKVILVGKSKTKCTKVTLDLLNGTCTKEEVFFNDVYNGKSIAENFWKIGEVLDNPNIYIRKN
jgi:hypothetical protein